VNRLLFFAAVVLFVLTALLVIFGGADKDLLTVLPLIGLGCLAAGHAV
jgi:hypothetical protein